MTEHEFFVTLTLNYIVNEVHINPTFYGKITATTEEEVFNQALEQCKNMAASTGIVQELEIFSVKNYFSARNVPAV
jgi:YesN/AraC family two-component response regulator